MQGETASRCGPAGEPGGSGRGRPFSAEPERQVEEAPWRRLLPPQACPAEGEAVPAEVSGRRLAVFRAGGEWFALDEACPHEGAPLSCGVVRGREVTCSWHGWHFDLDSGRSTDGLDVRVAAYPVRLGQDGWLEVRLAPDSAPVDDV